MTEIAKLKIWITRLVLTGLTLLVAAQTKAQTAYPWLDIGNTRIHFEVDGEPTQIPDDVLTNLTLGAPTVVLATDLVRALGFQHRFRDIQVAEASSKDGKQVLIASARATPLIRSIIIESDGTMAMPPSRLRGFLDLREGRRLPDVVWVNKDADTLQSGVRLRGYPNARVKHQVKYLRQGRVDVEFIVDFGRPCLIADFIPSRDRYSAFQGIQYGDLCDINSIHAAIREEEIRLRNQGYINARLSIDTKNGLRTSADGSRANLIYDFKRGERWELQILVEPNGTHIEAEFATETGFVLGDLAFLSHEELRNRILAYMKRQGFVDARVSAASARSEGRNLNLLTYWITPGREVLIDTEATTFAGELPISRDTVLSELGLRPGLLSFSSRVPYVEEDIPRMRDSLITLLAEQGYLQATVDEPEVFRQVREGTVRLRFEVNAGSRYVFGSVQVVGKPARFTGDEGLIRDLLPEGGMVNPQEVERFSTQLRMSLASLGYRRSEVLVPPLTCDSADQETPPVGNLPTSDQPQVVCTNGSNNTVRMDFKIAVTPGPLFRIGEIGVDSVPFDKGHRVLAESDLHKGDPLVVERITEARDRVLRHGLFGNVVYLGADAIDVAPEERGRTEVKRDLTVLATRPETWNLNLNPSYNTSRGYIFRGEYRRNNLTHDGLQLLVQGHISQEHHQMQKTGMSKTGQVPGYSLSTSLREPFVRFGSWVSPFDFNFISLSYEFKVRDEQQDIISAQSDISWRPRWFGIDLYHDAGVSYSLSEYRHQAEVSEPKRIIDHSDGVNIVELLWTSQVDTRDSQIWPRRGILISAQAAHSGPEIGSDAAYERYSARVNLFASMGRKWSLGLSSDGRRVSSISSPSSRRETLSAALVRGFTTSDEILGPLLLERRGEVNSIYQIPATHLFSLRSELRFRNPLSSWGLVLFLDTATAYIRQSEASTLENEILAKNPSSTVKILGNDPVRLVTKEAGFLASYWDSSYKSTGFGARYLIGDMFAVTFDWGIPIFDPDDTGSSCKKYSDVAGTRSYEPVDCISRRPEWLKPWDSISDIRHNLFEILKHTYISIEGRI